jgi:hypothetical protein
MRIVSLARFSSFMRLENMLAISTVFKIDIGMHFK